MAKRKKVTEGTMDRRILVYVLVLVICVFSGPFGTAVDLSFWDRVVFWTIGIVGVGFVMETCILTTFSSVYLTKLNGWIRIVLGTLIGGIPGTATIIFVNRIFRPEHLDSSSFPILWLQVSLMALLIASLEILLSAKGVRENFLHPERMAFQQNRLLDQEEAPAEPQTPYSDLVPSQLAQRLPARLRYEAILSLSMQDHYVEVHTSGGSEMLLMRLTDAMDLLDGTDGVRTHRSHWVSGQAMVSLSREGRRHVLTLTDGRKLPVSKSYLVNVQAALATSQN